MFYSQAMRFAFSDEQEELRRSVCRVLNAHASAAHTRRAMESEVGHDPALWKRLAGELGLTGLVVPEAHGGAGLGWIELVAVMEELGKALACVPFFSTVCLGTSALLVGADDDQQRELLPAIAAGTATTTLAHLESDGDLGADAINAVATPDGDQIVLTGHKRHVVDGHTADLLIVAARAPATRGADGIALYAVPATSPGVTRQRVVTIDQTRPLADIVLDRVRLPARARLARAAWPELERILAFAAVGLAAEQVGGAQRCLDLAVDYAKVRTQFGRPIGSFQAIQHRCADMFLLVESARSAAYYAGWAAAHEPDELATAAATAKSYCSDAFFRCAGDAIQIHGGIGFTWEHDIHLYFKRARASRAFLGEPTLHRERVAQSILGGE